MAAQRKYAPNRTPFVAAPSRLTPRLAGDSDVGGMNPVLAAQRLQIEALLGDHEPEVVRYGGAMRLAIIVGGSGVLWAAAAAGAWRLLAAL